MGFTIWDLGFGIWDLGFGICDLVLRQAQDDEIGIWDLRFVICDLVLRQAQDDGICNLEFVIYTTIVVVNNNFVKHLYNLCKFVL